MRSLRRGPCSGTGSPRGSRYPHIHRHTHRVNQGTEAPCSFPCLLTHAYVRYEVVAVHINGGQDQAGHEHHQAKGEAAQAVER